MTEASKTEVHASSGARVIFINNKGVEYTPSMRQRIERVLGVVRVLRPME